MRATMKFAVICVSLIIAAHADAADQRNQMNALDFQERGVRLRLELERAYQDLRHTGDFKSAGNDVSSIVKKYVPVGTSFAKPQWEFPRLCRGGSKSLTYPAVDTAAPSTKLRIVSRQDH